VLGLVGVLMLAVFPARALVAQHTERRQVAARIKVLDERNRDLEGRATALNTDTEIERLARQHYDLVRPGEVVFDIFAASPPAGAVPPSPAVPRSSAGVAGPVRRLLTSLTDVF